MAGGEQLRALHIDIEAHAEDAIQEIERASDEVDDLGRSFTGLVDNAAQAYVALEEVEGQVESLGDELTQTAASAGVLAASLSGLSLGDLGEFDFPDIENWKQRVSQSLEDFSPADRMRIQAPRLAPNVRHPSISPEVDQPSISPEVDQPIISPKIRRAAQITPEVDQPTISPKVDHPSISPEIRRAAQISPDVDQPTISPEIKQAAQITPEVADPTVTPRIQQSEPLSGVEEQYRALQKNVSDESVNREDAHQAASNLRDRLSDRGRGSLAGRAGELQDYLGRGESFIAEDQAQRSADRIGELLEKKSLLRPQVVPEVDTSSAQDPSYRLNRQVSGLSSRSGGREESGGGVPEIDVSDITGMGEANEETRDSSYSTAMALRVLRRETDEAGEEATEVAAQMSSLASSIFGVGGASTTVSLGPLTTQITNMALAVATLLPMILALTGAIGGLATAAAGMAAVGGGAFLGGLMGLGEKVAETSTEAESAMEGVGLILEEVGKAAVRAMEPLQAPIFQDLALDVLRGAVVLLRRFSVFAAQTYREIQPLVDAVAGAFWDNTPEFFNALGYAIDNLAPQIAGLMQWLAAGIPVAIRGLTDVAVDLAGVLQSIGQATAEVVVAMANFGQLLLNILGPAIAFAIGIIADLIEWFNSLPPVVEMSVIGVAAATQLLVGSFISLSSVVFLLTSSFGAIYLELVGLIGIENSLALSNLTLSGTYQALAGSISLTNLSLGTLWGLLGPIGWGIVGLIATLGALQQNVFGTRDALNDFISSLDWLFGALSQVAGFGGDLLGGLLGAGVETALFAVAIPLRVVLELLTVFSQVLGNAVDMLVSVASVGLVPLTAALQVFAGFLEQAASSWQGFTNSLESGFTGDILAALSPVISTLSGALSGLMDVGGRLVTMGLAAYLALVSANMLLLAGSATRTAAANLYLAATNSTLLTVLYRVVTGYYLKNAAQITETASTYASIAADYAKVASEYAVAAALGGSTVAEYARSAAAYAGQAAKYAATAATYVYTAAVYAYAAGAWIAAAAEWAFLSPLLIIVAVVAVVVGLIYAYTQNMWGLKDAIDGAIGAVFKFGAAIVNGIIDVIAGVIDWIAKWGLLLVKGLAFGILAGPAILAAALYSLLTGAIPDKDELASMGEEIIDGVVEGIYGAAGAVYEAFKDMAQKAEEVWNEYTPDLKPDQPDEPSPHAQSEHFSDAQSEFLDGRNTDYIDNSNPDNINPAEPAPTTQNNTTSSNSTVVQQNQNVTVNVNEESSPRKTAEEVDRVTNERAMSGLAGALGRENNAGGGQ